MLPRALPRRNAFANTLDGERNFGDANDMRSTGDAGLKRDPSAIPVPSLRPRSLDDAKPPWCEFCRLHSVTVCRPVSKPNVTSVAERVVVDRLRHPRQLQSLLEKLVPDLLRIAAIGRAQDGPAARQNAGDFVECEFERFFRPDQAIKAIRNADDLPFVLENRGLVAARMTALRP